ncbi:MAG: hypothetical protein ABI863_22960 [Ginsengibacter sp.]
MIKKTCIELLNNKKAEGLLFNYKHFRDDYSHYMVSHAWYPKEIRMIRNNPEVHLFAQNLSKSPYINFTIHCRVLLLVPNNARSAMLIMIRRMSHKATEDTKHFPLRFVGKTVTSKQT